MSCRGSFYDCGFLVVLLFSKCVILRFFFFFFQAEDGIRDRDVTGVQTCALPISRGAAATITPAQRLGRTGGRARRREQGTNGRSLRDAGRRDAGEYPATAGEESDRKSVV